VRVSRSVAPDGREAMLQHARELAALGIPFMFDPGQDCHVPGEELLAFVEQAPTWPSTITKAGCSRSAPGRKLEEMAKKLEALRMLPGAGGIRSYRPINDRDSAGIGQPKLWSHLVKMGRMPTSRRGSSFLCTRLSTATASFELIDPSARRIHRDASSFFAISSSFAAGALLEHPPS